jgi:hypothetical protein
MMTLEVWVLFILCDCIAKAPAQCQRPLVIMMCMDASPDHDLLQ